MKLEYNEMNKIKSCTLADGEVFGIEYDLMQNVKRELYPDGGSVCYSYDEYNQVKEMTLQNGGVYQFEYDLNGNRTAVINPLGERTGFAYDACNRLIGVTDPLGAARHYDIGKDKITITDSAGNTGVIRYDIPGRVISEENARGIKREYSCNEMGKLSCIMEQGKRKISYEYDQGGGFGRKSMLIKDMWSFPERKG